MTWETKKRMGPNQKQVVVYFDADVLREFDSYAGPQQRSAVIRELVEQYVQHMKHRNGEA